MDYVALPKNTHFAAWLTSLTEMFQADLVAEGGEGIHRSIVENVLVFLHGALSLVRRYEALLGAGCHRHKFAAPGEACGPQRPLKIHKMPCQKVAEQARAQRMYVYHSVPHLLNRFACLTKTVACSTF